MLIAGVDEVGRGSLAGPVLAAAVILDNPLNINGLRDSKKLSAKQRLKINNAIRLQSISWNISLSTVEEIDDINILNASLLAMKRAVEGLKVKPDKVYCDGIFSPNLDIPVETFIKGDSKKENIMAASIIAKVERDKRMQEISKFYPRYEFARHKGYPTKVHLQAIELYGPCEHHRVSFAPVKKSLNQTKCKHERT